MKRFSLKNKMFITFSIISSVIIIITSISMYIKSVNDMRQQTSSLTEVLSTQFSRMIDRNMKDIERLSLQVFTDPVVQEVLNEYKESNPVNDFVYSNILYTRLFNQASSHDGIVGVSIYTEIGTIFRYERTGGIEVRYMTDREPWMEYLDHKPRGEVAFLPTFGITLINGTNSKVVSLVRHIYNIPGGNRIGSLSIDLNMETFLNVLSVDHISDINDFTRIWVLGDNNELIYDTATPEMDTINKVVDSSVFIGTQLSVDEGDYIYAKATSDYTDWSTIVLIQDEFIRQEQSSLFGVLFVIISVGIGLIGIISYVFSSSISKPFSQLMTRMRRVEQGDLADRMELTNNPDVDLVTRVYNQMLDSINKLIKEVYQATIIEKNVKISALQSQINPHFLYNTLNTMKAISRVKGVEEVAEISEGLSDLFKYSMDDSEKYVTLSEELTHIRNYMMIQEYRFRERVQLVSDIQVNPDDIMIPKLLIQPLIENAVVHGISHLSDKGEVRLKIYRSNYLFIEVTDNGEGLNEEQLEKLKLSMKKRNLKSEEQGIGLTNVSERIRLIYGRQYGVQFFQPEGTGLGVKLVLPLEINPDN